MAEKYYLYLTSLLSWREYHTRKQRKAYDLQTSTQLEALPIPLLYPSLGNQDLPNNQVGADHRLKYVLPLK